MHEQCYRLSRLLVKSEVGGVSLAEGMQQRRLTLDGGGLLDVTDGGRINNVAHNEALHRLVLGHQHTCTREKICSFLYKDPCESTPATLHVLLCVIETPPRDQQCQQPQADPPVIFDPTEIFVCILKGVHLAMEWYNLSAQCTKEEGTFAAEFCRPVA